MCMCGFMCDLYRLIHLTPARFRSKPVVQTSTNSEKSSAQAPAWRDRGSGQIQKRSNGRVDMTVKREFRDIKHQVWSTFIGKFCEELSQRSHIRLTSNKISSRGIKKTTKKQTGLPTQDNRGGHHRHQQLRRGFAEHQIVCVPKII